VACEREAVDFNQTEVTQTVNAGTIVVAVGAHIFDPTSLGVYGYGKFENVVTSIELERMFNADGPTKGIIVRPSDGKPVKKVAFILCVGSRNEKIKHEWCSRVCCMSSIKQAVLLKDRVPGIEVFVNYTDIRSFGKGCEEFFNRARYDKRIRFYRSQIAKVMKKDKEDLLLIRGEDTLRSKLFETAVDLVVLAVGLEPDPTFQKLANILNISTGSDGFFLEAHLKIRPSESSVQGILLAGCAQGPKDIPDSIAQAESAAVKAIDLMQGGEIEVEPNKAHVDEEKCIHCRLCESICDFHAIQATKDATTINLASCTGCGACAAMCPAEAIEVPGFSRNQILVQIDEALKDKKIDPLIITFLCNWCSYAGADLAGTSKIQYPPNSRVIHVMCSAMVNPEFVIAALAKGADGVLVAGCHPQDFHYITGFNKTATRYKVLRGILEEIGFKPNQLRVESISAGEGKEFAELIAEFVRDLQAAKKTA
jgi:heterodisulfide reductase subunit A